MCLRNKSLFDEVKVKKKKKEKKVRGASVEQTEAALFQSDKQGVDTGGVSNYSHHSTVTSWA